MAVQTANTLFRFSGQLDHLLSVISNGFSPRLSKEIDIIGESSYYPMVCFCDIPLSMVESHMFKYGYYGIGMTKEWGVRNGLNPLLYYNVESNLITNFLRLVAEGIHSIQKLHMLSVGGEWREIGGGSKMFVPDITATDYQIKDDAFWQASFKLIAIRGLEAYFKPRVGEYTIGDKHYPNYHFYDEREWRYLLYNPTSDATETPKEHKYSRFIGPLSDERKEEINKEIYSYETLRLTFSATDIKYIIVKNANEILPVVNHLKGLKNSDNELLYTPDEIVLLTSRILTTTQIAEDF